jgi:CheY-like chemotaxis protein
MAAPHLTDLVRNALGRLDDDTHLAAHPLATALGQPDAAALRRALVDAIERVGVHPHGRTHPSVRQRQHRGLRLRYVDGLRREEVARQLGISVRQTTRDLEHALNAVSSILALNARPDEDAGLLHDPAEHEDRAADLGAALAGALRTVRKLAAARRVTLTPRVLDTLPAVALGPTVLRQALLNILMFALERAPAGRLTITATDTAPGVLLRLAAPGDPPKAASTVASELLDTAHQLLASQGARLARPDGALVEVVLPVVAQAKVLVVDDNPDVVRLFQRYLAGEPYRLIQATSGEGARRLAAELRPDVILLDVVLPTQDGWEVLADLRARPDTRTIPVVVCSVLPERALAHSLGVAEFLAKPVTAAALRASLARWCRSPGAPPIRP